MSVLALNSGLTKNDGLDGDTLVALQCVAKIAELPARLAVDQQDPGLVVGNLNRDGAAVVVGPGIAKERADANGQILRPQLSIGTRNVTTGREPSACPRDYLLQ